MQPEDFYITILTRLDTIDEKLTHTATKAELSGMATKTDLTKVTGELTEMKSVMATKTDLAKINQELTKMRSEMATKTELSELKKEMATKSDLEEVRSEMATKVDLQEIRNEMATKKEVTNLESRFIKKLDLFFLALDRDVMHNRQRIIRLEEHLHLPRLQT